MHKIYKNGIDFIVDNKEILNNYPIETSFYYVNAKVINKIDKDNYILKFYNDNNYLLALRLAPYDMLLFGDESLAFEAANVISDYNLHFDGVQTTKELGESFLKHYINRNGGEFNVSLSMDIMRLDNLNFKPTYDIVNCNEEDYNDLFTLINGFSMEALHKNLDEEDYIKYKNCVNDFYAIKEMGKIVSIARKTKEEDKIGCISLVYTLPSHRNKGYSKNIVSYLAKTYLDSGKIPYLFVDKTNPISNHVYQKIGFNYLVPRYSFSYKKTNVCKLMIAGGCFWCMAKPYYEYDGVLRVLSGYAGGIEINPTYEDVKNLKTGHRETIIIEYDSNIITNKELLDIYLENINPFDDSGQFIDRGFNYTCALFSSNDLEKEYLKSKLEKLEQEFNQKTYVDILPDMIFYKAEEYHQDYALKNPELMEKELVESGRKK